MKKLLACLIATTAVSMAGVTNAAGTKPAEINVAYFLEWPSPNQFAQLKNTYDTALGVKVNWLPFENGNEMNAAMASGEVQIAYSQGHVPFLVGVTEGLDLTMVGVAVGYTENDNCMLANGSSITRGNASQLEGKKVATQAGSVSHYQLLKLLERVKVDHSKVDILPMEDGASAAAALRSGEVVMACVSGSALRSIADTGKPLLSAAEQEEFGLRIFNIVTVPTSFMEAHADLVQGFMDVTEASNNQWKANPNPMRATIARAAGMDRAGSDTALMGFSFPSAIEQKSHHWMGKSVVDYTKEIADFFVAQGRLPRSLSRSDYNSHITTRFLR
jgi:taurine transport system substrate-binding protein